MCARACARCEFRKHIDGARACSDRHGHMQRSLRSLPWAPAMSPKNAKYDKVWKDDIRYNKKKGCFSIPTKGMGILLRKLPGIEHLPPELKQFFQEQKLQERVWEEEDAAVGRQYHNQPAPRSRVAGGDAAADGELEDSWVNATDLQRCETPPSMPPLIWQREALQGDVSLKTLHDIDDTDVDMMKCSSNYKGAKAYVCVPVSVSFSASVYLSVSG